MTFTTTSPYDAAVSLLTGLYGDRYESITKDDKAFILFLLGLAIDVADKGEDLRSFWDKVAHDQPDRLLYGFEFADVEGPDLERMIRSQHEAIAAQILAK